MIGLTESSRKALDMAEIVFGGPRHLALADVGARGHPWPVPFDVAAVVAQRGRRVAVLASGDPFWHGVGATLSARVPREEIASFPAPSVFSLVAARLGWKVETTLCLGLHAAPFETLVPLLHTRAHLIVTLRDGAAAGELAAWLTAQGWGASNLWVMEALGGPRERIRAVDARDFALADVQAPVAVAIRAWDGPSLQRSSGLPDASLVHDGQITKRPVRALTLSTLAPRPGEVLWDLGAGSGSISVEWCLAGGTAHTWEARADRAANIRANAARFGLSRHLTVHEADWADRAQARDDAHPNAVFLGGGLTAPLFAALWQDIKPGTRLVANAVTLETQGLVMSLQAEYGGELMKIDLAEAAPIGRMRGWQAARTVVQWSVRR